MSLRHTLLGLASLTLASCGGTMEETGFLQSSSQSHAIVKGSTCSAEDNPEALALLLRAKYAYEGANYTQVIFTCNATLIAPDVVLSAAHCLAEESLRSPFESDGVTINSLEVFVSSQPDLQEYSERFKSALPSGAVKLKEVELHPEYGQKFGHTIGPENRHDIALGYLETPLTITPAVVITADEGHQLRVDVPVTIAGWGKRSPTNDAYALKHCGASFINELGETEMQIGAGEDTVRKCQGDSGGPSFMDVQTASTVKRRVVGVTSHGYNGVQCFQGGLDTRVDVHFDWIDESLSAACDDGTRVWCDVKGAIPASYYEPTPTEKPDTGAGGGTKDGGGCASVPFTALAVVPLLVRRRSSR